MKFRGMACHLGLFRPLTQHQHQQVWRIVTALLGVIEERKLNPFFYSVEQSPPPTVVDVEEGVQRPGLGPQNIKLLGLQKEYIGLAKPDISLDYPSPIKGPAKDEGLVCLRLILISIELFA